MDLPINDKDLATIVNALALGGDARLYHLLKEVKEVRDANPDGPYKKLLREERTKILAQSDWMANSDVTMSDEWKTYRQALRDLPKTHPVNYGDPKLDSFGKLDSSTVHWPIPPS